MIEKQIFLRLSDGSTVPAVIARKEKDDTCWLHLVGDGVDESSTGTDYFETFIHIRKRLAHRGILPLCYAASRNVRPSGMARDMGQGLSAYTLKMGVQAEEMVDIFEGGSDMEPVTPDEQKAFSEAWFRSLKRK